MKHQLVQCILLLVGVFISIYNLLQMNCPTMKSFDGLRIREYYWEKEQQLECFEKELNVEMQNGVIVRQASRHHLFAELRTRCLYKNGGPTQLQACNSTTLIGPLKVNTSEITLENLEKHALKHVRHGGWWRPEICVSNQKTAIIIPIRNRANQLPILLRQLVPILTRQQINFRIFVIEQDDQFGFNRAKLFNIGFLEASSFYPFNCYVLHDVDLLPEDDRIDYSCKQSPKHLSAGVNTFRYTLFSEKLFGGVVSFQPGHFKLINGFSNLFYVWGGEDDVLYERVVSKKLKPHREKLKIGRYTMLKHENREKIRTEKELYDMKVSMWLGLKHADEDGLKTLQYKVNEYKEFQLYTNIKVDLQKTLEKKFDL